MENESKSSNEWIDLNSEGSIRKKILSSSISSTTKTTSEETNISKNSKDPIQENPSQGGNVTIKLIGRTSQDQKIFLEKVNEEGVQITIGKGEITPALGLDHALKSMKKGEKSLIKLRSKMAFGDVASNSSRGLENKDVEFEVELLDFAKGMLAHQLPFEKRLEIAHRERQEGNTLFKQNLFSAALVKYQLSLEIMGLLDEKNNFENQTNETDPKIEFTPEELKIAHSEVAVPCHLNLAATFYNMKRFRECLDECHQVLNWDSFNTKCALKIGMALRELGDFEKSEKQFDKLESVLNDEKKNEKAKKQEIEKIENELKKERVLLQRRKRESQQSEKQVYKNMFEKLRTGPALYENMNNSNNSSTNLKSSNLNEFFRLALAVVLNFIASTSIVFANKHVLNTWKNPIALTGCHFLVSFLGTVFCWLALDLFKPKKFAFSHALALAGSFAAFIVLANLSLHWNSVGVYQLMKSMTAPGVMLLQWLFFKEKFTTNILVSILITFVGVCLGTVTDLHFNIIGTFLGVAALFSQGLYQQWVTTKQKELGLDSFQLLFYQAPLSALLLIPASLLLDNTQTIVSNLTSDVIFWILLSSILGFIGNISTIIVLGKTSPITYNVLGYAKTVAILCGHFFYDSTQLSLEQGIPVLVALFGIALYTKFKMDQSQKKNK